MSFIANDVRYKQRFQNFGSAFNLLKSALESKDFDDFSDLELEGIVKRFEYTFELSWKLLKDYLEYEGIVFTIISPKSVLKESANKGFFKEAGMDAEIYLDMLNTRNISTHQYDFEEFMNAILKINGIFLNELKKQYEYFLNKVNENDV